MRQLPDCNPALTACYLKQIIFVTWRLLATLT